MSAALRDGTLTLRPCEAGDAPALHVHARDPVLTRYLAWAPHEAEDETRAVLASLHDAHVAGKACHWTVREDGAPLGLVSLIDIRRAHRTWRIDRAELAYWIGRSAWGRGLAKRAAVLAARHGRQVLGLQKIVIANVPENIASRRVAEGLGARLIGVEHRAFHKNGSWHDLEWRELLFPCSGQEAR